jgi:hypothetical protein
MEAWCPFSARELPRLQEIYDTYRGNGLEMVGLMKLNKGSTEEIVQGYLDGYGVTFPVARVVEDSPPDVYPGGVPYAVIAKRDTIVWRGHPGNFSREAFDALLASK